MSSAYAAFDVMTEDDDGARTPLPLQTVEVYDVTNDEALDDLETDANGHIDAGTVTPAAGTTIRFGAETADGRKGYAEIVTT
jgi:hypothetical protein